MTVPRRAAASPRLRRLIHAGLTACALVAGSPWCAAEVEIVDYGDVGALRVHSQQDGKVQYEVISQPSYAVRLTVRQPGTTKGAVRHDSEVFRLVLKGGEQRNPPGSGRGTVKLEAGDVRYMTDLDALHPANTLVSDTPFEELEVYVPPIDDEPAPERDAEVFTRSRKRQQRQRSRTRVDAEHPVGNVLRALRDAPLRGKPFVKMPLIKRSEQKQGFYASLLVLQQKMSFKGSLKRELVLIPVEGSARVDSNGPIGTIGRGTVLRLPVRDLREITLTPDGGRFAAVALLIGG